jgi:hypothetical protein
MISQTTNRHGACNKLGLMYSQVVRSDIFLFEMPDGFERTTFLHIPWDRALHDHSVSANKGPSQGLSNTIRRLFRKRLTILIKF